MEDFDSIYGPNNIERQQGSDAHTDYKVRLMNQSRIMDKVDKMPGTWMERFNALQEDLRQNGFFATYSYLELMFHLRVMLSGDFSQKRRIDVCYSSNAFLGTCIQFLKRAEGLQYELSENQGCIGILAYNLVPLYYRASVENGEYARSACLDDFAEKVTTFKSLSLHVGGVNIIDATPIDKRILTASMAVINDPSVPELLDINPRCLDFIHKGLGDGPKG